MKEKKGLTDMKEKKGLTDMKEFGQESKQARQRPFKYIERIMNKMEEINERLKKIESKQEDPERRTMEIELLLSLDPNNPEHVAAYAETQGGMEGDIARMMLTIHQDEFVDQIMKEMIDKLEEINERLEQL